MWEKHSLLPLCLGQRIPQSLILSPHNCPSRAGFVPHLTEDEAKPQQGRKTALGTRSELGSPRQGFLCVVAQGKTQRTVA